jgi:uncharacterized protein (TIGR01777 family)
MSKSKDSTTQTIGITGGTGFVGRHLAPLLVQNGYKVVVFTRNVHKKSSHPNIRFSYWNPYENKCDLLQLKKLIGVVHLAGAGVADKRWTDKRKKEILSSRIIGAHFLIDKLRENAPNCKCMIAASAIGYYGPDRNGTPFHEDAAPHDDFLSNVCVQWEAETSKASGLMRVVIYRMGIILGKDDGAFPRLAQPQSFGVVPILGSGKQMMSWIHIDDLCRMYLKAIQEEGMQGTYNAVAPAPVTHKQLMKTIAREKGGIKIPIPVPTALLKAGLGEMATEVLKSCTVSADKIQSTGFSYDHPEIKEAVSSILKADKP